MRKFLIKATIFLILSFAFFTTFYFYNYQKIQWEPEASHVNSENFDVVILGSSHAIAIAEGFQKEENYRKTQSLAVPAGGIKLLRISIENFFQLDNTAEHVLIFIDPFMIYTAINDNVNYLPMKKYKLGYYQLIIEHLGVQQFIQYLNKYTSKNSVSDFFIDTNGPSPSSIDINKINKRLTSIYRRSNLDDDLFQRKEFKEMLSYISTNTESKIILCIPPVLFGNKEPFRKDFLDYLLTIQADYKIPIYDYSDLYLKENNFQFFYDYDHLNKLGREAFVKNQILPILE